MDNFKVIYRILKYLETAMDYAEVDTEPIKAENLRISEERWLSIMTMLLENGYIKGIEIKSYTRSPAVMLHFENIKVIGQVAESHPNKRTGVPVKDVKEALLYGKADEVRLNKGKPSQRIIADKCVVTVNPETRILIQTNPREGK